MRRITLSEGAIDALDADHCHFRFPAHFHDTFAFGVIESGFHQFITQRGCWLAGPGSIIALAPGETHRVGKLSRDGYSYRMLYPTVEFIRRHSKAVRQAGFGVFREPILQDPNIFAAMSSAIQGALSAPDARCERPLLDALLECIERYLSPAHGAPDAHRRVQDAATFSSANAFLHQHLREPIRLSSVAEHCGLSSYNLNRLFVRTVGVPPHAYLIQLRVNRARALLSQGQSVAEATYSCGFSDQSHLNRLFKRVVGIPPGRFLRSLSAT